VEVYSIGFTQKSASQFFESLRRVGIQRLVDVRLNNMSQLAGFSKRDDLQYFLRELCGADYIHELLLAPTEDMFGEYKKRKGSWELYERRFFSLLRERQIEDRLDRHLFDVPTVLLCSEPSPEHCHRRLVLEYLTAKWGDLTITHL
jgi:uncharacterized protein (DUF488 family)